MKVIMKVTILSLFYILSHFSMANSNSLLNQDGSEIDFTSKIVKQKQLNLDDPFLIQLYSNWKSLGSLDEKSNTWVELILDKKYKTALKSMPGLSDSRMSNLKDSSELYLIFKLGHYQTFLTKWFELAARPGFLKSQFAIAIDQVSSSKITKLISEGNFLLDDNNRKTLGFIENEPSAINNSLQAFKALRTGENATRWIGKLNKKDPMRMRLAQSAILHYAKVGKLGASGKIIKSVIEPVLENSNNEEEIALYFMTLGRLLYQAGALNEAKKYYEYIPESSKYFLKAQTEVLWVYLRERDFSKMKGELATLELEVFDDKFYPEAYVISAMANVMLCQFVDAKKALERFIKINGKWAKKIGQNLSGKKHDIINEGFFIANLNKAKVSLDKEMKNLKKDKLSSTYMKELEALKGFETKSRNIEHQRQWTNRKTILETALYKMKFVKIELISRMRQMALKLKFKNQDKVSRYSAALKKGNEISFPNDGVLWGDDLFQMSAEVKSKCTGGKTK